MPDTLSTPHPPHEPPRSPSSRRALWLQPRLLARRSSSAMPSASAGSGAAGTSSAAGGGSEGGSACSTAGSTGSTAGSASTGRQPSGATLYRSLRGHLLGSMCRCLSLYACVSTRWVRLCACACGRDKGHLRVLGSVEAPNALASEGLGATWSERAPRPALKLSRGFVPLLRSSRSCFQHISKASCRIVPSKRSRP